MYFDESSKFRTVRFCSHLFSSCSTLEDNLFTSVAINRGPFAAVADALRYRWRQSPSDRFYPSAPGGNGRSGDQERVLSTASHEFVGLTDLLDQVPTGLMSGCVRITPSLHSGETPEVPNEWVG